MPSFGEELKRERELRRISLREISESTKINIRYLEALENNDFRHLPGGVFNKGFVRAFAQFIGVDPESMVNAYLLEEQNQGTGNTGHEGDLLRGSATVFEDDPPAAGKQKSGRTAGLVVIIAVLATVSIIVAAWYYGRREETPDRPVVAEETAEAVVQETNSDGPEVTDNEGPGIDPVENNPTEEPPAVDSEMVRMRIVLVSETTGRINCDNRRVTILDDFAAETTLNFECTDFLIISAADGGAVELGRPGGELRPLGDSGVPVDRYRILPGAE
jgi:cytoskeletal protein RodZ